MNILLIDDKANEGWKQIIEKVFPIQGLNVCPAINYDESLLSIKEGFDLIFLDIRINENDHKIYNVEDYSGYKILKEIRKNFTSINFSTPIILLTASNKIWNIDAFRNFGVDAYYIKEHPNYIFDRDTSRQNFENLKTNFERLIFEGAKRKKIWALSTEIIKLISKHPYFKENTKYENVKKRIIDKLKLGYVYLFKVQTKIEKELLKTNNEALAFIIYWSILEEIVKGFSDLSTWNNTTYYRLANWKFRNNEYFVEDIGNENIRVNISKEDNSPYLKKIVEYNVNSDHYQYNKYVGLVNLSEQVYALLAAYTTDNITFNDLSQIFKKVNTFRNRIDFIHSNTKRIFEDNLIRKEEVEKTYGQTVDVLSFIMKVLKLI
jgi:CheY-like chemotaxis protein